MNHGPAPTRRFDHLATMVAVVRADGHCVFANAAFESVLGLSRRCPLAQPDLRVVRRPGDGRDTVAAVARNEYATSRFEGLLRRPAQWRAAAGARHREPDGPRSGRDRRDGPRSSSRPARPGGAAAGPGAGEQGTDPQPGPRDQEPARRHPRRGTAARHGGRGPVAGRVHQVIIAEADRLQALVDRLLAPHRLPQQVGDVNIHEVCERAPAGSSSPSSRAACGARDYDTSIPEFRGDREQLIQAVLNVAQCSEALTGPHRGRRRDA